MTATHVNGIAVITDEAATAPISGHQGQPITFKQIRLLLLEDGSTVYGCIHCDFTAPSHTNVRGHLQVHNRKSGRGRKTKTAPAELSLKDLLDRIGEFDKVTEERDLWKARALKAEKDLKSIREALGVKA